MDALGCDLSIFPIPVTEDQLTVDADGEVEEVLEASSGADQKAKDALLIKLLSSLCQKIDKLG